MKQWKRIIGCMLILCMTVFLLTGCIKKDPAGKETEQPAVTVPPAVQAGAYVPTAEGEQQYAVALNDKQRNSLNMLNYLAMFTQDVVSNQNSRLALENAYSSLMNNIRPNAIDPETQRIMDKLFTDIEAFRMIAVKRERLRFEFEQAQARAILDAAGEASENFGVRLGDIGPNLVISLAKAVTSTVLDSVSAMGDAEMQYLKDGWELDDEGALVLHAVRKDTFNYMVNTVRDYDLPGELTMTEEVIAKFVEWKGYSNNLQRIHLLESEKKTYQQFGPYWLTLAACYFDQAEVSSDTTYYEKCLEAISQYEALNMQIFRKDFDYARIMPMAIASAYFVLPHVDYMEAAEKYIRVILDNTNNSDWALRYFAANIYLMLSVETEDNRYAEKAYDIALNNATYLLTEQKKLNEAYLNDLQEVKIPEHATKQQKKEIRQYNKLLKEEHKTALPPVYKPLLLNCELLFALAERLEITENASANIDGILHENGNALFITRSLDEFFRMKKNDAEKENEQAVLFNGHVVWLNAQYLSEQSTIVMQVTQDNVTVTIDDWVINQIHRNSNKQEECRVAFHSKKLEEIRFTPGDRIVITVLPYDAAYIQPLEFKFHAVEDKVLYVIKTVSFQRIFE